LPYTPHADCRDPGSTAASPALGEAGRRFRQERDLDATDELDVTSAEALLAIAAELRARHVRLALAHLHATVADLLRRADDGRADVGWQAFPSLDAAVRWATGDTAQGAFPVQPRS
jgi:MFS superfamily sulfate permease-like transporter